MIWFSKTPLLCPYFWKKTGDKLSNSSSTTHQIHDIHRALGLSNYIVLDRDVFITVTWKWFILLLHLKGADRFNIRRGRLSQRQCVMSTVIVWSSISIVVPCGFIGNLDYLKETLFPRHKTILKSEFSLYFQSKCLAIELINSSNMATSYYSGILNDEIL